MQTQYGGIEGVVIQADLDQAAAPILYSIDGGQTFHSTPFQTADASHSEEKLAALVDGWLDSEGG